MSTAGGVGRDRDVDPASSMPVSPKEPSSPKGGKKIKNFPIETISFLFITTPVLFTYL